MQRHPQGPLDHVAVARVDGVAMNRATVARADNVSVALYMIDGRIRAIQDSCLRCSASLAAGERVGGLAICTGCGWVYDIVSGAVEGVPALCVERFDVVVDGGDVWIAVPVRTPDTD